MKRPKLKRDWVGLRVKTLVPLSNGYASIPAGTVCLVKANSSGLRLSVDACPHCGRGIYITKVSENDVLIVGTEKEKE